MNTTTRDAIVRLRYLRGDLLKSIAFDLSISKSRVHQIVADAALPPRRRYDSCAARELRTARALWAVLTENPHRTVRAQMQAAGIAGYETYHRMIRLLLSQGYIRELGDAAGRHGRRYEVVVKFYGGA